MSDIGFEKKRQKLVKNKKSSVEKKNERKTDLNGLK